MRLIDADALIEKFTKEAKRTSDVSVAQALMYVCTCLDCVPTIEQPKWISCAERLPTETGYYFVCHKGGLVAERYFYSDAPELFVPFGNEPVTHWMHLPMPPKGNE